MDLNIAARERDFVVELVSMATHTERGAFLMKSRGIAGIARARQLAMYLLHIDCEYSLALVGELFGRDKSTVGHAVRIIEDMRDDTQFEDWISLLENAVFVSRRARQTTLFPDQDRSIEMRA